MRAFLSVLLLASAGATWAQVTAEHLYSHINAPFWVRVSAPKGVTGAIQIELLKPVSADVDVAAAATLGRVDLAKLFPDLWKEKSPQVRYAQLVVGGKKVGPALVLQPMLNPQISRLKADGKTIEFVPDEDGALFNGYRAYVDADIVIETDLGSMEFRMRPDCAPNTVWTLMQLVSGGLYTDTTFHRVVAKRADGTPFVIQGGDPTGTGSGGPGFAYPLEDSPLPHDFGVISIARANDPNTNGCQFFVCLSREGTKHLDHKYASFGQCVSGAATIRKIAAVPVGDADRPVKPVHIKRAYLVLAKPYGDGPKPVTASDEKSAGLQGR